MCLLLWIEVEASQREVLESAASQASGRAIRVAVQHASRWPWANQPHARAFLSEQGGCACRLTDEADWEAATWSMRPDILEPLAETIAALLATGVQAASIQGLWTGDAAQETKHVSANEMIALARTSRLGTRTRYIIDRAG